MCNYRITLCEFKIVRAAIKSVFFLQRLFFSFLVFMLTLLGKIGVR